jgi:Ca2+-binding RTX toxin-like protein
LGNDTLNGRNGAESIYGGHASDDADTSGNDTLDGGDGTDMMYGGPGDDTFFANDGYSDTLDGGPGTDSASTVGLDTTYNIP